MTKPMTPGEVETLRTILRFGGRVSVSMGKKTSPQDVRTSTINSLERRGYIRLWTPPTRRTLRSGRYRYDTDYMLTAKGVRALNQVDNDAAASD